ncbi:hypothetical protein C900_05734 [Fulvivirga imtechensis AK7]|uniref:Uncharacterized protein n=1 Tax=Fulvivirga imtechensis AK7 TaxID=1237149 RepID=L8JZK7_9BACT|nr:hypothetical protein C900_05734 [Fulvivirga imtechensis AK7]
MSGVVEAIAEVSVLASLLYIFSGKKMLFGFTKTSARGTLFFFKKRTGGRVCVCFNPLFIKLTN